MRGLYAIVDASRLAALGVPLADFADAVLAARPRALQLRAKALAPRDTLSLLRQLVTRARQAGVPLFANDRPDLALLGECDGVHVGQTDLAVSDVRRIASSLRVGVSSHTADELEAALAAAPDYVAFGPVFGTQSKDNPDPSVGLDGLARAAAETRARGVPLVAIGGIDLARAPEIARHADAAAVIAALLPEPGEPLSRVTERARALHRALGGAP